MGTHRIERRERVLYRLGLSLPLRRLLNQIPHLFQRNLVLVQRRGKRGKRFNLLRAESEHLPPGGLLGFGRCGFVFLVLIGLSRCLLALLWRSGSTLALLLAGLE